MTKTFVEQLEAKFESPETARQAKPTTLAEHVSNELMQNGLPRIAPELFELKRKASVMLDEKQKTDIGISLLDRGLEGGAKWIKINGYDQAVLDAEKFKTITFSCQGNVPRFFYGVHDQKNVVHGRCLVPEIDLIVKKSPENIVKYFGDRPEHKKLDLGCDLSYNPGRVKKEDWGNLSIVSSAHWEAPYALDASAEIPQVPEGFIELGDEAIAEYYAAVRTAPPKLRKTTKLISPRIGVLWAPSDSILYATGKIPEPQRIPQSEGDPALILDIPDGERSYKHIVAVWDIGEELPFRNYLAEFSKGRLK
ncbi:MAG: hypothetical protein ABH864_04850 [archaeon]